MITILQGDVRERLRGLADESVNCVVTSPPYFGLRDYGVAGQIGLEPTPELFVAEMAAVFEEVRRVLRNDGTLWLNLGDSYAGSWGARGRGVDTNAPRPDLEVKHGKTAPARNGFAECGVKPKDLMGMPWRVAFALQAAGWYLRQDIIWSKPNPMPESVTDRCTKAHEYIFLMSKSARYHYAATAIKEASVYLAGEGGHQSFGKPGGKAEIAYGAMVSGKKWDSDGTRNKRSVWTVATKGFKGAHFATFPPKLIEPCILAGCPVGGTVLDPFFGAGTTGLVAEQHGRNCIGIELNPEYVLIATQRLGLGVFA